LGNEEPLEALRVPIGPEGGSLAGAYLTKEMIVWDGQGPVPEELRLKPPYDSIEAFRSRSFAVVPLMVQGKVIGVLGADRKHTRRPLDVGTLELLQLFTTQAALVIEQARLYQQAKEHVAELSALNQELELARRAAEEANRLKGEFLANTSHELRTPLNGLIGFLQLVLKGLCDSREEEREYLERALDCAKHLLGIINDVLDLARIEAGKLTIDPTKVTLASLLGDVSRVTQVQAAQKGIRLEVEPCEETVQVWADEGRLKQVFLNLIGNALKFTPQGGEVRVRVLPKPEQGYVLCEVEDTGIGIPKAKQHLIFEKFVQGDGSTTRKYGGAGLGLAITRNLVELMGGFIGVESEEGKGSRFFFSIPTWHPERDILWRGEGKGDRVLTVEGDPGHPLILVVEDDPGFGRFLVSLLHKHGFATLWAITADEAYETARRFHPRVAVIDYGLPSREEAVLRTGWDLVVALQKTPGLANMGLVIVTGYDRALQERLAVHALPPGVLCLEKPVEAEILINTIRELGRPKSEGPVRILVATDEPALGELIRLTLPPERFQVTVVSDGQACLNYLAASREAVDILLLDLKIPKGDGFRVLKELKFGGIAPELPVLVITGNPEVDWPKAQRLLADGGLVRVFAKEDVLREPEILTGYILDLVRARRQSTEREEAYGAHPGRRG